MTAPDFPPARLRTAVVVGPGPDTCEVFANGRRSSVRYAAPFRSRAAELRPGQLVAVASASDRPELIIWRWFDAVVLGDQDGQVRLWEPAHGDVSAQPRRPERQVRVGSRAYLSAGLPGASWWLPVPPMGLPSTRTSSSTRSPASTPSTACGTACSEVGTLL